LRLTEVTFDASIRIFDAGDSIVKSLWLVPGQGCKRLVIGFIRSAGAADSMETDRISIAGARSGAMVCPVSIVQLSADAAVAVPFIRPAQIATLAIGRTARSVILAMPITRT
jgi:hypothetical protein